jgi:molybdopterin/thiamine biosynthesis adenylyltransferase
VTADGGSDRFARQRLIPGWEQSRLAAATVIIVGVGALGNEVAKNLALAGVGRLVLCDPDVVAETNLSRTVLFGPGDVDTPKAVAAAAALPRLAPDVLVSPRVADMVSGVGLGELGDADLVIGCVDTIRARVQLLGRCALAGAVLLDGGTSPWGAEIRLRLSPGEPCFGCTLSASQRSVSDLPWSCAEPLPDAHPQAAAIATTAVCAGWLSAVAFGLLFGKPPTYRVLSVDVEVGRAAPVTISRDPECPLHRPLEGPEVVSPADELSTVGEFLATVGAADEAYTWNSFPLPLRCSRCGAMAAEALASAFEPGSRCPRCGAVLRERFSTRLRDAAPDAVLARLGVAAAEILPVMLPGGEMTYHRLKPSSRKNLKTTDMPDGLVNQR